MSRFCSKSLIAVSKPLIIQLLSLLLTYTYFYVDNPVSYDNFEDAYAAIEKDYKDFTEIRGFEKIDLVELN